VDFLSLPLFLPENILSARLTAIAHSRTSLATKVFIFSRLACGIEFNSTPHPIAFVRSHFVIRTRSRRCLDDFTFLLSCSNDSSARYEIINNDFIVLVKSISTVQEPMTTKILMHFTTPVYDRWLIQSFRHQSKRYTEPGACSKRRNDVLHGGQSSPTVRCFRRDHQCAIDAFDSIRLTVASSPS